MGLSIKKEDNVLILSGKEKGKKGRVLRIVSEKGKIIIEKINIIKKHMKPNKQNAQGGIIEKEGPINFSKIMLLCPRCGKPTKIANKKLDTGKKVRVCKKCKEVMD
ncbi:Ribosomal protein L24 [Candidatus Magnetoovum chiemensis]|nr:Ribosomal protein L24 [Candidatus Magnetoovum chiemensis]